MRIDALYRYPVKGLSAEALDHADLVAGETVKWDRAFALALGDTVFDPARPEYLRKSRFMCLMRNARAARIRSRFDEASGLLRLRMATPEAAFPDLCETPFTPEGRARIGAWLGAFLGAEARGVPVFHYAPGHSFADQRDKVVSLINAASLAALEGSAGAARDRIRFRANLYFSGLPAWEEFEWVGRTVRAGGATLEILARTDRCPATEVNPETAERDANPLKELHEGFGHTDLGVHARVLAPGRVAPGDTLVVL